MLFALPVLLFTSCGIKKYLQPDQYLLTKNKIEIEKPYKKETERSLEKLYKQRPNRKFLLAFRIRPYFYIRGSQGNDNWYKRIQRESFGEQPALLDSIYIEGTVKNMKTHLTSKGYYYADVDYKVKTNRAKHAIVTYYVRQNLQYKVAQYDLQISDRNIYDLISRNMKESVIDLWKGLDHGKLLEEQERVILLLRNNGYYNMSKDYVDFDIDTAYAGETVRIALNITNPSDFEQHKKYYVNQVTIEIDRSINKSLFTSSDTVPAKSFVYIPHDYKLNPEVLERNLFLRKDAQFRVNSLSRTYSRMSDLGIFRFINIQAKPYEERDSGFVNYHVKLIPAVKYDFTIEPQALTSDQNATLTNNNARNYGVAGVAQLSNRNVFHGAEILQLSLRGSLEVQGQKKSTGFFNSREVSSTIGLTVPRTLFLPSFDRREGFFSNKTTISVTGLYEENLDYRREAITTALTYQFNKRNVTYTFAPLEVSFIRSAIIDDSLDVLRNNNFFLQTLFSNNLIIDFRFGFTYTNKPRKNPENFIFLKWDLFEMGGTPITVIKNLIGDKKDENGHYTMFGLNYFEYIKTAADFRYNNYLDVNNTLVYRVFTGVAVPYGNSPEFVPFEKRFFVGGVNSLRGWRPRSIGPGSYSSAVQLDYSGEIKLELNTEFRFNIYNRWFEGAVFTDAGNVWNIKPSGDKPNAHFDASRFYKELALDAGFGLRLNFEIFIIRFDFGIPLHDPRYPAGERWIIQDFSGSWMLYNTVFNFGIGYPF